MQLMKRCGDTMANRRREKLKQRRFMTQFRTNHHQHLHLHHKKNLKRDGCDASFTADRCHILPSRNENLLNYTTWQRN
jgi:hypothetical protein